MDEYNYYKDDGKELKRQLDDFADWMKAQRMPLYDFGWNMRHVPEPRDERGYNR